MHAKLSALALALAGLAGALAFCSLTSCTMKQFSGSRDSGQSKLMDDTFAGQNACNPDDHNRPFIIEWDATDMSYFESLAASDVVIVKYEGCKLRLLDECRNDSVRGSQGAYKPPEWTSGSLETIDIHNEGELYAKLPLGQASLAGRVGGGESFHMEYYVAGTVFATREAVYRGDFGANPGCDDATHFVYAYNLGAFALGSQNEISSDVGGSVYGFGAGGSHSKGSSAEKKGGDLGACQSDAATEIAGCKTPIRLNLRKVRDGASPEAEAMSTQGGADGLNAAGLVDMKVEMSDEAKARLEAAMQKLGARDGAGCLTELDVHDALDPDRKSTDPKVDFSIFRNQCVMLTGKCDAGRANMRKSLGAHASFAGQSPEHIDAVVDAYARQFCPADSLPAMEQMLVAIEQLQLAARQTKKDVGFCDATLAKIRALEPKLSAADKKDSRISGLERTLFVMAPMCYQRAGDCGRAWDVFADVLPADNRERFAKIEDKAKREEAMRGTFDGIVKDCAGK